MRVKFIALISLSVILFSCGEAVDSSKIADSSKEEAVVEKVTEAPVESITIDLTDKGVGPITSVEMGEIDQALVDHGKEVFRAKCTACHKMGKRVVGPALKGITERRSPEWIMNMILNPEVMVVENETAKQLLKEYSAPMANQGLTQEEARAVLELFRTHK